MSDEEFRAALDWRMCSDPWPSDDKGQKVISDMLDRESKSRGFASWVVAYHEFNGETP